MVGFGVKIVFKIALFFCVYLATCNMGDKDKSLSLTEPVFAKLAEGEGSFRAIVYDEQTQCTLKDFSFFGHTSAGGVRRETDDSVTRFEISKIKEIKVLKPHFDSKRFGDKDFLLAQVTSTTGAIISDLLVPKKLIVCGIDEKTGLEKSWFLQKIDRIVVQGPTPLVLPSIPTALIGDAKSQVPSPAPLVPAASGTPGALVNQAPTQGSSDKTKRTYRSPKENKWDNFYKQNQFPDVKEGLKHKKGIIGAFMAIVDACIDFVKAIINGVWRLFK